MLRNRVGLRISGQGFGMPFVGDWNLLVSIRIIRFVKGNIPHGSFLPCSHSKGSFYAEPTTLSGWLSF